MSRDLIESVSTWKLDARDEDSARYFYAGADVARLASGDLSFVVGRKGSGKTAIAEYLRNMPAQNVLKRTLSFKNFIFNELFELKENTQSGSQFTNLWMYIIYYSICEMMAEDRNVDELFAKELRKYFRVDLEQALSTSLRRITDLQLEAKLFGLGGGGKSQVVANETSWARRAEALENIIRQNAGVSTYYALFDELDENYKGSQAPESDALYLELLSGLFKACTEIRRRLGYSRNVRPIVFLRADIFDRIKDSDRGKWDDFKLSLNWSESKLQDLVAFRISRAASPTGPILDPKDAIVSLFQSSTVRYKTGQSGRRPIFDHMFARTLRRPRDVISWLRAGARVLRDIPDGNLGKDSLAQIDEDYSADLRREFMDEMHPEVPQIREILNTISHMRKLVFEREELESALRRQGLCAGSAEAVEICRDLFRFSVVGNQPRNGPPIFQYQQPAAELSLSENLTVHRGLVRVLGIV